MSALKYLVVFLLVGTVCCYPHIRRRYVRSPNLQMQQPYSYPNQYPNFYPDIQFYQPGFPVPNYPMIPSQPIPYPHSNPWMMPSYPPYGSGYPLMQPSPSYPSYPSFPSYPSYPSYPYQSQPDPYAHIPTEIIDVDVNDNFESFSPNSNSPWYPGLNWGYINKNSSDHNQTGLHSNVNKNYLESSGDTQRQVFTNIVTGKPFTATITRVYESESQDPKVDVRTTNSKPGSGVLIEATGDNIEENENNNADDEETTDNQISKLNDDKNADEEEEEETTYSSLWG